MRHNKMFLLSMIVLMSLLTSVEAKTLYFAVIIGNAEYQETSLPHPVNDANEIAMRLEELGFETLVKTNVNKAAMKDVVCEFGKRLQDGGIGVFYYSGLALHTERQNYLLPADIEMYGEAEIGSQAMDVNDILHHIRLTNPHGENLIIFDTNQDHSYTDSFRGIQNGLTPIDVPPGFTQVYLSNAPDDYILGWDDVIRIRVLGEDGLDRTVTVDPDGFIHLPSERNLQVNGLTLVQCIEQITTILAQDILEDPEVEIELLNPQKKRISILGMVQRPGYRELRGDNRLLGALLDAGGPTSFWTEARVLRWSQGDERGGETQHAMIADMQKLFIEGDQTQNFMLQDGDVLMVTKKPPLPSNRGKISQKLYYVIGSVKTPGAYEYHDGDTVLDAIQHAGGFTEFAVRNRTRIDREVDGKTQRLQVKMKDVVEKNDMEENIEILPGDLISVPEG